MKNLKVTPGTVVSLSKIDSSDRCGLKSKKKAGKELAGIHARLKELQAALYAERSRSVLIVLQAMDAGGKDSTIRRVFGPLNPHWVQVTDFKAPTAQELAHDYLWRIHNAIPPKGKIGIFNRSHYEDVLVVRVHDLVPEERWSRRYRHINEFERMLADEGTTILKFFLHISKDEQKERLQARLDNPAKHWKFSLGDLAEREHWDDYQAAFEAMLTETSTDWAPWYVVPADRKWYRDLMIGSILANTLESFDMQFPPNEDDLTGVVVE